MWSFLEEPWQYRVLELLPPGVDRAQLAAAQRLTPTERLESVVALVELGNELRSALLAKEPRR
jgi:hypothetical protein